MDIDSTFDKSEEVDLSGSSISPLSSLMGQKTEAIQFTYQLFRQRPELFGSLAEVMLYAQYAGHKFKPANYYAIFEQFIRQTNNNYINDKREGILNPLNPYTYDADYLITWARVIQKNQMILEFEPVMRRIKTALNDWLANPTVSFNGIRYPVNMFKPLCYTFSGENYITLLPYICYLFTFFIYCYPYEFDEGQTESSTFGFYKSVNEWYAMHYAQLTQDLGFDVIKTDIRTLTQVTDNQWRDLLDHMLNADQIIRLRNEEITKTPELENQCISDQNSIPNGRIKAAFEEVMSQLIKIAVTHSPVRRFFDKVPQFNSKYCPTTELMMLTQYCLSGGSAQFICEPEIDALNNVPGKLPNFSYVLNSDPNSLKTYPTNIIKERQSLSSQIDDLKICIHKPFCAADVVLEMATAYLKPAFTDKITDILDDMPIEISEDMLRDQSEKIYQKLIALFVNGCWMYDNSSMSDILNILNGYKYFQEEISDILNLASVTLITYTNRQASVILPALMLSYLNVWLLDHVERGLKLHTFAPFTCLACMDEPSPNRIKKLIDMSNSLLYISNPLYCRFVNVTMNDFSQLMLSNVIIQQPYVKGLDDFADVYAIGGVELYNYSHYANPLIRGYGWLATVFGSCEALETFYKWIYRLDNSALFEFIDQSLNAVANIETSLKTQWLKMIQSRKHPRMLRNYIFKQTEYTMRNVPYFIDLQTSDKNYIISLVCKYTFPYSNPRKSITREIVFREIVFRRQVVESMAPVSNAMRVNSLNLNNSASLATGGTTERLPVYDYTGTMENVQLIYTSPNGMRCVKLTLFNSRNDENSTVWMFTNVERSTRFQRYKTMKFDNPKGTQPAPSQEMYPERVDAARTRVIKDYLNQRTLNQL